MVKMQVPMLGNRSLLELAECICRNSCFIGNHMNVDAFTSTQKIRTTNKHVSRFFFPRLSAEPLIFVMSYYAPVQLASKS